MSAVEDWIDRAADEAAALAFPDDNEATALSDQTIPAAIQSLASANGVAPRKLHQEVERTVIRDLARQYTQQDNAADYDADYLDLDDLDAMPPLAWLIDDLLPEGYALMSGRDASFKTFIALDMALSIAAGIPWRGKPTRQTRVLYVAGEGARGLKLRIAAWLSAHPEVPRADVLRGFTVRRSAPNFYAGGPAYTDLIARAGDYGMAVLDTLRRISGGADGNGSDMAVVVDCVADLTRALNSGAGGLSLVLAHTQRSDQDTRGYTGIEDDADAVFHVVREGHALRSTLEVSKQKDGEDGTKHTVTLMPVGSSLVVDPSKSTLQVNASEPPRQRRERLAVEFVNDVANIGATQADIVRTLAPVCGRSTAQRTVSELVGAGRLVKQGPRYYPGTPASEAAALGFDNEDEEGASAHGTSDGAASTEEGRPA